MWRQSALSPLILCYVVLNAATFFDSRTFPGAEARYFSEGGGFELPSAAKQQSNVDAVAPAAAASPENLDYLQQAEQQQVYDQFQKQQLAQVLDELYAQEIAAEQQRESEDLSDEAAWRQYIEAQKAAAPVAEEPASEDKALEELARLDAEVKQLAAQQQQQQQPSKTAPAAEPEVVAAEEPQQASADSRPTAQKKGQSEFVEFVEPPPAKVLKAINVADKRAPVELVNRANQGHAGLLSATGNIMFIALVTMCCVVVVGGVVGGAYYYNNVRKQSDNDFDDFTRYSPAGPAKKLHGLRNGVRMDENGDDSLAYKAQLHHYQQTKQKIIGGEDGGLSGTTSPTGPGGSGSPRSIHHGEHSEDEAEDLEEHNYSVYECPGLAPTGDIEVQNPHFGH
uniref:Neural proliferation differentiation and control protein 1 n=1 Tax=Panagrellus redivivus TaxID=6233 RepID=A0A7E4VUU0_PANRE